MVALWRIEEAEGARARARREGAASVATSFAALGAAAVRAADAADEGAVVAATSAEALGCHGLGVALFMRDDGGVGEAWLGPKPRSERADGTRGLLPFAAKHAARSPVVLRRRALAEHPASDADADADAPLLASVGGDELLLLACEGGDVVLAVGGADGDGDAWLRASPPASLRLLLSVAAATVARLRRCADANAGRASVADEVVAATGARLRAQRELDAAVGGARSLCGALRAIALAEGVAAVGEAVASSLVALDGVLGARLFARTRAGGGVHVAVGAEEGDGAGDDLAAAAAGGVAAAALASSTGVASVDNLEVERGAFDAATDLYDRAGSGGPSGALLALSIDDGTGVLELLARSARDAPWRARGGAAEA